MKDTITLKRGELDVGMFTALASETPAPTREAVDEEIYSVENEEDLPQDAKSMTSIAFVKDEGEAVGFNVWVADTDEARYEGLSSKQSLQPQRGMLFDWKELSVNGLMMRDMSFPIDMVFVDDAGYVQGAVTDVQPEDSRTKSMMCRYAVELPAGSVEEFGLTDTDTRLYVKTGGAEGSSPQIFDLEKDRVYIDDPSNIPDGASVHEGQRGGLYYETGGQTDMAQFQMETDAERMEKYEFTDEQIENAVNELQRVKEKGGDIFGQWLEAANEVATITGGSHRTKSVGSALEKVHKRDDSAHKYDSVEELTDLHGSKVKVSTVDDAKELYEKLQDEFDIVETKNHFEKGGPYRAHHLKAEVEGEVVEFQIKQKDMAEIASASHSLALKPEEEAPVEDMETLDEPPDEELQDQLEDCMSQQADFVEGLVDTVDCDEQAAAILDEYYALG